MQTASLTLAITLLLIIIATPTVAAAVYLFTEAPPEYYAVGFGETEVKGICELRAISNVLDIFDPNADYQDYYLIFAPEKIRWQPSYHVTNTLGFPVEIKGIGYLRPQLWSAMLTEPVVIAPGEDTFLAARAAPPPLKLVDELIPGSIYKLTETGLKRTVDGRIAYFSTTLSGATTVEAGYTCPYAQELLPLVIEGGVMKITVGEPGCGVTNIGEASTSSLLVTGVVEPITATQPAADISFFLDAGGTGFGVSWGGVLYDSTRPPSMIASGLPSRGEPFWFVFFADSFSSTLWLNNARYDLASGLSDASYPIHVGLAKMGFTQYDIAILIDTSGSMGEEITAVKNAVEDYVWYLSEKNARVSIGDYSEPANKYNREYFYVDSINYIRLHTDLTSDYASIIDVLSILRAIGMYEYHDAAAYAALTQLSWNELADKHIILITDENGQANVSSRSLLEETIALANEMGVKIHVIFTGTAVPEGTPLYEIATGTGGIIVVPDKNRSAVYTALVSLLQRILEETPIETRASVSVFASRYVTITDLYPGDTIILQVGGYTYSQTVDNQGTVTIDLLSIIPPREIARAYASEQPQAQILLIPGPGHLAQLKPVRMAVLVEGSGLSGWFEVPARYTVDCGFMVQASSLRDIYIVRVSRGESLFILSVFGRGLYMSFTTNELPMVTASSVDELVMAVVDEAGRVVEYRLAPGDILPGTTTPLRENVVVKMGFGLLEVMSGGYSTYYKNPIYVEIRALDVIVTPSR